MRILAYCTQPAARAVQAALGVTPLTSPPLTAGSVTPELLEGYDVLYFRLHGDRFFPETWYGEDYEHHRYPALELGQVYATDLNGAIVIVANCYGAEAELMVEALYEAGARAVIAGSGPNYAAGNRVIGTDLLARWIVRFLKLGFDVGKALQWAKRRLQATRWRKTDKDALAFEIIATKEV